MRGLGYASPAELTLVGGSGEFEIDLAGPWDKDGVLRLDVRLGDVILFVPARIGVTVLAREREADDLILPSFTRDDEGGFRSPGFENTRRRITVVLEPGLGTLEARPAA